MVELRERAPEAYKLWINTTESRNDHEIWASRKTIRQPYLLASLGQWLGLFAVLAVLGLAGFAVHLGYTVFAGIVVAIDVVALAAVFNGNNRKIANEDQVPPE